MSLQDKIASFNKPETAKRRSKTNSARKLHSTQNLPNLRTTNQTRKKQIRKIKQRCLKTWKEKTKRKKKIHIKKHSLKRIKRSLRIKRRIDLSFCASCF